MCRVAVQVLAHAGPLQRIRLACLAPLGSHIQSDSSSTRKNLKRLASSFDRTVWNTIILFQSLKVEAIPYVTYRFSAKVVIAPKEVH